jgi:integrase
MSVHVDRVRGTWLFIFDLPRAADGRRRQMMRRGFATEQQAAVAEQAARRHAGVDMPVPVAGSVAGDLVRWLRDRELDVALTSLATYRSIVRRYLIPRLGDRQLHALDRYEIHDLYRYLLHQGSHTGGPLSAATVRKAHRVLMKALKDLDVEVRGVRQPRPADTPAHGRKGVWTAQQCGVFLAHTANDRLHAAWTLALVCGLRRGELAGLKWSKVDLDRGAIHVHCSAAVLPASSPAGWWRKARKAPAAAPSRSARPWSTS